MTKQKYKKLKDHKNSDNNNIRQKKSLTTSSADDLLKEIESEEKNNISYGDTALMFSESEKDKEKRIGVSATPPIPLKQEFPLMPFKDPAYRRCPKCNKRVWKTKAKREGLYVTQIFKCKNKRCDFFKEIRIGV